MRFETPRFKQAAVVALHDERLRTALARSRVGFIGHREAAVEALPEFEQLRDTAAQIKDHVLDHLDYYLQRYEQAVVAAGGKVHWAHSDEEAQRIIVDICRAADAKVITKGKSMVSEEIGLNDALIAAGYEVVETDLGEYIIQLAKEPPSHIVGPALHKTREQVTALFAEHHGRARKETVAELVTEAREMLRDKFFRADVGITGGNFLIAETGTSVIVTNEGNGDLTQTLPRVHIVTSGIERVLPSLDDLPVFLRLLARSATGQDTETYTTLSTGPRRAGDPDGPEEYHVVLVDNGRSQMLGSRFRKMLRCIRCGACMNHCPVYGSVGGHAYGWVYPGPMGAVLTPIYQGLKDSYDLPNACTLNGRCQSVCPVKIPLPEMLRELRHLQHVERMGPRLQRHALAVWRFVASQPWLYRIAEKLATTTLARLGGPKRRVHKLPFAEGWTQSRDLPAPAGSTFLSQVPRSKRA
ncbi:MAG: LutB/LldF family L-lactate oxidation iron-sulfur protein [Moraxellaceae bacterium]|nr:LutB/LldF family L-lactate oxidation iron-sulfur protein [Moraxellaceae bacterium]